MLCISWGLFLDETNIWTSWLSLKKRKSPSAKQVDIIQATEGLNRTKRRRKDKPASRLNWHPSAPALGHQDAWFSGLWTRTYTITPGSQTCRLRLNCTTDLLCSALCRWQIVGLLGLHNHEPFPRINVLSIHIYSIGSFSGESWPNNQSFLCGHQTREGPKSILRLRENLENEVKSMKSVYIPPPSPGLYGRYSLPFVDWKKHTT